MYALQLSEQATESDNATVQVNRFQKVISTLTTNLGMMAE
jgi:hypothetical protein